MNGSAILCSHLSTGAAVCYRALIGDTARCVVCSHHLGYFGLLRTTEGVMLNSACPSDLSGRVMRDGHCPNKGVIVGLFTSHGDGHIKDSDDTRIMVSMHSIYM